MKILTFTTRRLLIFLGTVVFIFLVRKSWQQRKSLTGKTQRGLYLEFKYTTLILYSVKCVCNFTFVTIYLWREVRIPLMIPDANDPPNGPRMIVNPK